MRELEAERHTLGVGEVDDRLPGLGLGVVPETGVLRRDATLGHHGRGLGEDEPDAAERERAVVHAVPVVRYAVDRGVLAHRRQDDPVAQREAAHREGFEEGGSHAAILAGHRVRDVPGSRRTDRATGGFLHEGAPEGLRGL